MRVFFVLVFSLCIYLSAFSQNPYITVWANQYGGQLSSETKTLGLVQESNGNIITVGLFVGTIDIDPTSSIQQITSAGQQDIFIAKHNSAGQLLWYKRIGGIGPEQPYDIAVDLQGNIFISGWFREGSIIDFDPGANQFLVSTNSAFAAFILKLDSGGNFSWVKELESATFNTSVLALDLQIDNNQNLIIAGEFSGVNVDFDPSSNFNFLTSAGFSTTGDWNQGGDIFILKLSNAGNFVWVKQIGSAAGSDIAQSLIVTSLNEIILTGGFTGIVDFDPSPATFLVTGTGFNPSAQTHFADIFVLKLNSSGEFMFVTTMGGNNTDSGAELALTASNEIIFTGNFSSPASFTSSIGTIVSSGTSSFHGLFGKISPSGQLVWVKLLEGNGLLSIPSIKISTFGNIFLAGFFSNSFDFDPGISQQLLSTTAYTDCFLAKYTSSGDLLWTSQYGGVGSDQLSELVISSDEATCILTGAFASSILFPGTNQPQLNSAALAGFLAKLNSCQVDTSVVLLDLPQVCTNSGQVRLQAGVASSYQWLRNGVAISGATARLFTATQTGTYRVALVNSIGCRDTSRAIIVTLYPQPVSGFTINPSTQCYTGNQFSFTNTTTLPSGNLTYFWYFGNGATSTQQSPTYTYPAIGTYIVKLIATSSTGCKDSTTTSITVNASPTAGFQVNNASQCLSGNNFIFTNSSLLNPGTLTYLWTFGDGNTSTNTSPSHTYAAAGTYTVKLVASSGQGCKDSTTRTVTVYPTPSGVLNTPSTNLLCEGGVVILTATGGTSYQWFLNGGAIAGATNSTHSANQPGIYTVNVTSSNGCTSTATGSITLQLISKPSANFNFSNYCATFPTQFNDQSNVANSGVVNYSWNFGQGQGTSTLQNPSYTYPTTGTFSISLMVTPVACPSLSSNVTKPITIVTPPANQRYTTLNAVQNRDLQLEARAFGAAVYSWSPTSGLNNAAVFNPVFNFNTQVEYLITITTPIGCVIKDTQLVRIYKEKEIYVPKGFSPNGDGSNDKIFPRLVGIRTLLYFKIYDRWGQLIYQTSNENEGWDGRYRGVMQPIDTYVWIAEGVDIDNNNLKRTGTFLLLR